MSKARCGLRKEPATFGCLAPFWLKNIFSKRRKITHVRLFSEKDALGVREVDGEFKLMEDGKQHVQLEPIGCQ